MKEIYLNLDVAGIGYAPNIWYLRDKIKMQRLYYIIGGKGSMNDAAGRRIPLEVGKIYIHPYNLTADYKNDTENPIRHIFFDFISTPPIISNEAIVYDVPENSAVYHTLKSMESLFHENNSSTYTVSEASPEYMETWRVFLKLLLCELSLVKPLPFLSDEVVLEVLTTINREYMNRISVKELAAKSCFEVNYFIRRFSNVMGVTPYAYIRALKLMKAKELLAGGMTIVQAAQHVGYENASSLSRAMRHWSGMV